MKTTSQTSTGTARFAVLVAATLLLGAVSPIALAQPTLTPTPVSMPAPTGDQTVGDLVIEGRWG